MRLMSIHGLTLYHIKSHLQVLSALIYLSISNEHKHANIFNVLMKKYRLGNIQQSLACSGNTQQGE